MPISTKHVVVSVWIVVGTVWLVGALAAKRTVRTQSPLLRLIQLALGIAAVVIGFTGRFEFGWLMWPVIPSTPAIMDAGLLLLIVGAAFAIWARLYLGGNWSGNVTVKEGHQLVRRGPYAVVRHPIYSGLTMAFLGTVVVAREARGFVALALLLVMQGSKIHMEERLMIEQFDGEYLEYRQQTKRLIPLIW